MHLRLATRPTYQSTVLQWLAKPSAFVGLRRDKSAVASPAGYGVTSSVPNRKAKVGVPTGIGCPAEPGQVLRTPSERLLRQGASRSGLQIAFKFRSTGAITEGDGGLDPPGTKLRGMLYAALVVDLQAGLKIVRQADVVALRVCFRLEHVNV